jgi:hypothetical protein
VLYFFWNKSNEKGVRLNHSTQNVKFVSLNSIVKNCFWWIGFMGFWHHLGNEYCKEIGYGGSFKWISQQ